MQKNSGSFLPTGLTTGILVCAIYMAFSAIWQFNQNKDLSISNWAPLAFTAMLALILIPTDGLAAEKLNAKTKLGEHLQALYGGILSVVAAAILLLTQTWPWQILIVLAVLFLGLQLIHELAVRGVVWTYPLKAQQQWIHPLFATTLYIAMVFQFVWEASHNDNLLFALAGLVILGIALRWKHLTNLIEQRKEWRSKVA